MAGSSSNLDGPSFSGSYTNKMERSSSFRESSETSNRASRSVQSSSSSEIPALSQYLNLEPVSLLGEQHKHSRSAELRRVLGVSLEDHSFAQSKQPVPDELKRFKTSLADSSSKARERVKLFQEAITSVDKYKSVVLKRRQRNNEMSSDKPTFSKLNGAHQGPSETTGQRPNEERPKNLVPNKRARSSLAESRSEGRGGNPMRQSASANNTNSTEKQRNISFEKDKNAPGDTSEEKSRGLAPGGEGWEKKLKRKRSVGSMVNRATDNVDPPKQRPSNSSNSNAETRAARFSDNGLAFRSGLGSTGMNKTEQNKVKVESDNHTSERRDKDRPLTKSNKLTPKDEPQSSSLPSTTTTNPNPAPNNPTNPKPKPSRGPRSSSFVTLNSSPSFSRFPNSSDAWDPLSKSQPASPVATSATRKRANPPSPPVAQWAGQRPHKIQRTRRAHVISPVERFEDGPVSEASPAGSQMRDDTEESKGKANENGDLGENVNNTSKMMSLSGGSKKNSRGILKDELGLGEGGVRRQGRTGRGGTGHGRSASLLSVSKDNNNKMDSTETVPKPPKSGRPASSDKNDRIGRPPLKKAVDRKSHGRPGQSVQSGGLDAAGEQEDDKEDIVAAINAARTACYDASTGTFWKKVEPIFSLPSSDDLSLLKAQIAFAQELDKTAYDILAPGYTEDKSGIDQSNKADVATDDWFEQSIPLSQRLLSAFISTDDLLSDSNPQNGNGNDNHYPSFDNKGLGFCNGFGVDGFLDNNNNNGVNRHNGSMGHERNLYEGLGFEEMSFDDRILVELHSIGIYPDSAPELDEGEGEIDKEIFDLQNQLTDQVKEKKSHLQKLEKDIKDVQITDESSKHLEQIAMDKLIERTCKKLSKQGGRGGSNHKNNNKMTKQLSQAFAKRTLARCHKFEKTGHSCFSDPAYKDLLLAPLPTKPTDGKSEKGRKIERGPSDLHVKTEFQKERTKKREVLLDDVSRGGAATSSFGGPKWKKSDQNKDNKNSNVKGGARGERKNKAKPKQQKMAHLSAPAAPAQQSNSEPGNGSGSKRSQQEGLTGLTGQVKDSNEGLFTELPLSLDDLDVTGDGQDLGSWLNVVDDEALLDNDLVGLQIPMDDLADLTFN